MWPRIRKVYKHKGVCEAVWFVIRYKRKNFLWRDTPYLHSDGVSRGRLWKYIGKVHGMHVKMHMVMEVVNEEGDKAEGNFAGTEFKQEYWGMDNEQVTAVSAVGAQGLKVIIDGLVNLGLTVHPELEKFLK